MIKAVLFDVDGVLLDSFEANVQFYRNLLTKAGYAPPTEKDFISLMHYPMKEVIRNFTRASDDEVERIFQIGRDHRGLYPTHLLNLPEHAIQTIEELSKIYTLGIVTSRIKKGIYTVPQLKKIEKYFQVAVGFEDTSNHKPHPDPLLFAIKNLKVNPEETVYVGDAESDILAAKAAGLKMILYGKEHFSGADAYTDWFKNLPKIIKEF